MGCGEATQGSGEARAAAGTAGAVDWVRASEACGVSTAEARQQPARAPGAAAERDGRAERGVVCGLQGAVQDTRWGVLLPADGDRRLQPVLAGLPGAAFDTARACQACVRAVVPGVRASADHPDGQWCTVCVDGAWAAVASVGVVDPAGDPAGVDRAGLASAERAPRADAQDTKGRDGAASGW